MAYNPLDFYWLPANIKINTVNTYKDEILKIMPVFDI